MEKFESGGYLVQSLSELPKLKGKTLYCDLETSSGDPKKKSLNPWRDCTIAGIAISSDSTDDVFYVPIGHNDPYRSQNLPRENVFRWWQDCFDNHQEWHNQNVKYDAHVAKLDAGIKFDGRYRCTINSQAKLFDSERVYKGGYGLDVLTEQMLGRDIRPFENRLKLYLEHSEDYGDVCPRVMGAYACQDVYSDKDLDKWYIENMPEDVRRVVELEEDVTKALIEMEQVGLRIEPVDVRKEQIIHELKRFQIQKELYEMYDKWINPSSPQDMEDVLCTMFGLPVLAYTNEDDSTKESNPSFSKDVLKEYMGLVNAPKEFLTRAIEYRESQQYSSLFLNTYAEKHVEGLLHAWFNQIVRTGRMSCAAPNLQQLSSLAKKLILPLEPGWVIFRADYSQIEQRIIYDYIGDLGIIQQFLENPDMDTYMALANKIGCGRKPAKVISLGSGYGMGVKKLTKNLSSLPEVLSSVEELMQSDYQYLNASPDQQAKLLQKRLEGRSKSIYYQFHRSIPGLKPTAKLAEDMCKKNGFVRTKLGRRRHIDNPKFARKAFNAACQGSSADLTKIKVAEFVLDVLKGTPVKLLVQVHDELVFCAPKEVVQDPRFARDVFDVMEDNPLPMRIPIRVDGGWSETSWYDAGLEPGNEGFDPARHKLKLPFDQKGKGERLQWLK